MSTASLVTSCSYHFGNTAGLYQGAAFVGHTVSLPMRVAWLDDSNTREVTFVVKTQDIETWGDWNGHQVLIGEEPIGLLKDPDDRDGRHEIFRLGVERPRFERFVGPMRVLTLTVALETQPAHPALSDG